MLAKNQDKAIPEETISTEKGDNGVLQQIDNPSHDEKNIKKDTRVNLVLISNHFFFFWQKCTCNP